MKPHIPRHYRRYFRKPFVPTPPPDLAGFGMIDSKVVPNLRYVTGTPPDIGAKGVTHVTVSKFLYDSLLEGPNE